MRCSRGVPSLPARSPPAIHPSCPPPGPPSCPPSCPPPGPGERWRTLRATAPLLLLALEGGIVGALLDAEPIRESVDAWWSGLLARGGAVVPVAVAVGTAILLLDDGSLRAAFLRAGRTPRRSRSGVADLLTHLACFGLFVAASLRLFGQTIGTAVHPGAWALAWMALGLATVGTWVPLVVAPSAIGTLLAVGRRTLLAGTAVGSLAWLAGEATERWWMPLRDATVSLVAALLPGSGLEVGETEAGVTLALGDFAVVVGRQCSGYEGIGLMAVFVAALLVLFRATLRFPAALLLLPVAIAASWLANGLRLAALLLVGAHVSPSLAMGGFHSYSGSLLFSGVALGIAWWARRSPLLSTEAGVPSETGPTAAWIGPMLALLAVGMLTGLLREGGPDPWYGARLAAATAVLALRPAPLRALAARPSPAAFGIGAVVFFAWLALAPLAGDPGALPEVSGPVHLPRLALRMLGAVAVVPIVEELAFRGWLLRRLAAADFESVAYDRAGPLAVLASSLLFGAMHEQVVAGTIAGIGYALAAARRGRLVDAVAAHATTNALLLSTVLATGRGDLWG